MAYPIYPSVDGTFNFPPEVRNALAKSAENKSAIETNPVVVANKNKNTAQDTRLANIETKNAEQDVRADNIISTNNNKHVSQDARMTNIESKNTAQDTRVDNIVADNSAKHTQQDTRMTQIEAKDTAQDLQLAGLTSAIRTRATLPAGDLFALVSYNDNGIYTLDASLSYTNKPFDGSGSLTVTNDYQGVGTLLAQRDITGELWITINTTASGGSFVSWAQIPNTRGMQLTTEHLDTIITPGDYWVRTNEEAITSKGYPFPAYGDLKVRSTSTNDANVTQTYTPSQRWASGFAVRSRYNEVWGAWELFKSETQMARGTQLTTENLDTIVTPGRYWQRLNTEATKARNYPFEAYGALDVLPSSTNDANISQVYTPSQRYGLGFAIRSRHNTVWEEWRFFTPSGSSVGGDSGGGSGFKVTPLALTLGQTGADAPTTRSVRFPLNFAAPIPRFRVHIRNWNPRLGLVRTGAVTFTGLWLGKHAGDGAFASAPTQLRGGFATPENGDEWVSQWFSTPIGGGTEYLLSYGYTAPSAPYALVGGSWQSGTASDAPLTTATVNRAISAGFDVWIEAETPATTPVVGMLGDSLSCGVGSTLPVHDSVISQYARKIGALPYHLAASGDSMLGMMTVNPSKVTRWSHLVKPDSILWALGSNDLAEGIDLATMQTRFLALMQTVKGISPTIYLADIMPRDGWAVGSINETVRRQYNNWLRTLPAETRDVFAFAASISTDDETITPVYNADGTHLNTLGYTKNTEAIVRPLTSSPTRDTGVKDITSLVVAGAISSGTITLQHKNGWNAITMNNVKLAKAGNVNLFPNHNGSLKPWAPGVDGVSAGEVNENLVLGTSGTDSRRLNLNYTGGMSVYGGLVDDVVNGTLIWPMNRTLP